MTLCNEVTMSPKLAPPALLALAAVAEMFDTTSRGIWDWVREGKFPPPDLRVSLKSAYWRQETINGFVFGGKDRAD
jgi:hypothetical protein